MQNTTLLDLGPDQLQALMRQWDQPAYRGQQIASGLYQRGVATVEELTDLPKSLRGRLAEELGVVRLGEATVAPSPDGTTKYLFELADGARIESVAIARAEDQWTYCISSQVGCRMACVFCATGKMGLVRHLSAGEIVAQVLELRRRHPATQNPRLVFMGMGEPLDNFDALASALEILTHPDAVGLSARRITVSTSGLVEGIASLGRLRKPYGLAVSLTTGDANDRRRLMPIAGQTSMELLLESAAHYGHATNRKVTLECALIAGQNDTTAHAKRLLELARRGPFKVNLIPLNPIDDFSGDRPERTTVDAFASILWQGGVVATVRDSAGREVQAACGQLLHRQRKRKN